VKLPNAAAVRLRTLLSAFGGGHAQLLAVTKNLPRSLHLQSLPPQKILIRPRGRNPPGSRTISSC